MCESATQRANKALRELWERNLPVWPSVIRKLWPLQYVEMMPGKLLFVGLNPSHQEDNTPLLRLEGDFSQDLTSSERTRAVLGHEMRVMGAEGRVHPYFRQFKNFSPDSEWNHLDLLAVRHTNQSELSKILGLKERDSLKIPFVADQLKIFLALAAELAPPIVVVCNALGSDLMRGHLSESLRFDMQKGYYRARLGEKMIPWFFTGMLTGQRALDTGSRERLIWHVRWALSETSDSLGLKCSI